jgi:predicted GNAT family acetyltransferase
MAAGELVVTDNQEARRFELREAGEVVGWIDYLPGGTSLIFAHTEIVPGHEQRGFGSALVGGALDEMRRRGTTVIPSCAFTAAFIQRHQQYTDVVDPSLRDRFA